jgi:hypothetical protein
MRSQLLGAAAALLLPLSLGALPGCAGAPRVGAFGDDAFYAVRDHYRVGYAEAGASRPSPSALLGPRWLLDNFVVRDGEIRDAKSTPEHRRWVELDRDDDGRVDHRLSIERHDLRLTHEGDGSVLWAQTSPVGRRVANRDLEVIALDFVDRVGGGSYFEVDWGAATVRERRVGTAVRAHGPVTVDGVPGHEVTFDIVSLDQREAQAEHQGERVTVVIVRPEARWAPSPRAFDREARDDEWPMLVFFGHASRAERHDAHREDFERFLSRVDFHETD